MKAPTPIKWSMGAALGAAVAASACCTAPFVLVSLGISGAWLSSITALEPLRPLFMALAVGFFGFAAGRAWQPTGATQQDDTCTCDPVTTSRRRNLLFSLGGLVTSALLVSPYFLSAPGASNTLAAATPTQKQIMLTVEGMTCAGCASTVQTVLAGVPGVNQVQVSYEPPHATVSYDPAQVTVEALIQATRDAGYPSSKAHTTEQ